MYIYLFIRVCVCRYMYLYVHTAMHTYIHVQFMPPSWLWVFLLLQGSGPELIPPHLAWPLGMGSRHRVAVDICRGPIWAPESTPEAQVAVPGHWPPRRHRCAACTCPVHSPVLTSPGPTSVHGLWVGAGSPAPCRTPGMFG